MMSPTPRPGLIDTRTGIVRVALGAAALLVAGQIATVSSASAEAAPAPSRGASFVDLGTAASYSVLSGTGVANTGPATVLALDLGLSPSGVITGFPPGVVTGTTHDKDTAAATAQEDRQEAYDAAAAQTGGTAFAGDQAGATFTPGLYTSAAAFTNTGTMTLDADGDSSAVFVFQVGAALSSAAASKVVLTDGALANNVYWQVLGAVSLGAGARFVGTFLAAGAVSFGEGASLKGRILTPGTVALANSPVTQPIDDLTAPVVSIDGGAARSTNDTTPTISGTTDEPAGRPLTVRVGSQTLTTSVTAGGLWAVSTTPLTAGPHDVLASITDASQNTGTATQVLTVDVTAPTVSITGGATRATNDTTPSISGTTNESGGPTVTVTVAGQTLTTTADVGGAWSVEPAALAEAPHQVRASITDVAQNAGIAIQVLTVDVTVPVVTIDGGATRSTRDSSPWTYGTTAEQAGTTVRVTVAGQALVALVRPDGTWGVSAATVPDGTHLVVASVTDAAQNTGTASQSLTVAVNGDGSPGPAGPGDPGEPGAPSLPALPVAPAVPVVPAAPGLPATAIVPAARYLPDAAIRPLKGKFVGVGSYEPSEQRVTKLLPRKDRVATFEVRVTNRGDATDRLEIRGAPKSRTFAVTYLVDGQDVTRAVAAGTYRTGALKPGTAVDLVIRVTRTRAAKPGAKRTVQVRVGSAQAPGAVDTVAAVVRSKN